MTYRMKSSKHQVINIVPHATSWLRCAFHSLATMIVVNNPTCVEVFPSLKSSHHEAAYMNRIFTELYQAWLDETKPKGILSRLYSKQSNVLYSASTISIISSLISEIFRVLCILFLIFRFIYAKKLIPESKKKESLALFWLKTLPGLQDH